MNLNTYWTPERREEMRRNNPAKRPEVREKMSKNNATKRPEIRRKLSNSAILRWSDPENRQKIAASVAASWTLERKMNWSKNNPSKRLDVRTKMISSWSPERKIKWSRNNPAKKLEIRRKLSVIAKDFWTPERLRLMSEKNRKNGNYQRTSERMKTNNPMYNPETVSKVLSSLFKFPTKPEQTIIDLIEKYQLSFKYNGNHGDFIIERRIPDFINIEKKLIMEFDGPLHFIDEESVQRTEDRNRKYQDAGYCILCLTYDDLENEIELLNKIKSFEGILNEQVGG